MSLSSRDKDAAGGVRQNTRQDEQAYVEMACAGIICGRCGATLATYADQCSASLDDPCPGFMAIEAAKQKFNNHYLR